MDRARLCLAPAVLVGLGTLFISLRWLWGKRKARPPTLWRKVGEIAEIFVFPVKSLGPVRLDETECTIVGCKSGWLRDRSLLVVDDGGRFVTARKCPKMVQIIPSVSGSILSLSAPGMKTISVDLSKVEKKMKVVIWGDTVPSNDCGEEVAKWLSRYVFERDSGVRLVYYPLDASSRTVSRVNKAFHLFGTSDLGLFTDETSYALMNQASVDDLNTKLEEPVDPLRFRLNFTVTGARAYEEDTWDWVKIGSVTFRNVRPCSRCVMTTISPETGEKHPKVEPLETLKKYRQPEDPVMKSLVGTSPSFGIHLGLKSSNGIVRVGDPVYVG